MLESFGGPRNVAKGCATSAGCCVRRRQLLVSRRSMSYLLKGDSVAKLPAMAPHPSGWCRRLQKVVLRDASAASAGGGGGAAAALAARQPGGPRALTAADRRPERRAWVDGSDRMPPAAINLATPPSTMPRNADPLVELAGRVGVIPSVSTDGGVDQRRGHGDSAGMSWGDSTVPAAMRGLPSAFSNARWCVIVIGAHARILIGGALCRQVRSGSTRSRSRPTVAIGGCRWRALPARSWRGERGYMP
jgi:hypothetical protein